MSTAEPPPDPKLMSDAALIAAWGAIEDTDDGSLQPRAKAILDEIERRELDI